MYYVHLICGCFTVPCEKRGWPYSVRRISRKSSATHSYRCVQYFPVSEQCYGCQCLGFLTCTHMLMHAIAHRGCTDTVRQSALKADTDRKIPCRTGDSNPRQYCTWLFNRTLYQLSYPRYPKYKVKTSLIKSQAKVGHTAVIIVRFFIALFSTLEQTHCAHVACVSE